MSTFVRTVCAGMLLFGGLPAHGQERGSRRFDRSVPLEDSAATSANVSIGDVNADGHQDIVLVKGRHWPLEDIVLLGRGNGSFQPAYPLGGPPDRSYSGVLVDVDRDGDLDVVVSNDTPDAKIVHLNDGRGRFVIGSTFGRGEWSTRHIGVVDLNGDALPDVILANRPGPSYACFGVKGGKFAEGCVAVAQGSATTITFADFNRDGSPDLVVPYRDKGQSFIYLNDGKGGFVERRPFGRPDATIRSAEPSDLDRDGVMDLVVIDERTGPAIFWGRADGTFSAADALGTGAATPYAIAVADLDRNGRPDVIVGHVESRPIVYFNDGPRTFNAVPFGDNQGTAYGFAVGDLDEDGFLDIAMARSEARNMLYFGAQAELPAPPGKLVDIGGRRLHLLCSSQGAPTVILEAGASSFAIDWTLVQREIGKTNRVCSYDRAGMGWSDPSTAPNRSPDEQDLHTLLNAAGERPPFVLAGASRGGLLVRAYLADHPDEVAGLVLVDPASEDRLFTMFGGQAVLIASLTADQQRSLLPRYPVRVPRRTPQTGAPFDRLAELYQTRVTLETRLIASIPETMTPEMIGTEQERERVLLAGLLATRSAGQPPLGARPTVVLSRGDERNAEREAVHAALAKLSTNSRHTVVPGAGHEIHLFEPDTVVQAISDVLQSIRSKTPLPQR